MLARLVCALSLLVTALASAQTVYLPVQYQYGRHGEVFYGGANPWFHNYACVLLPEDPRNGPLSPEACCLQPPGPTSDGLATTYTPAIYPLTQRFTFASPAYRPTRYDEKFPKTPRPLVFTDLEPFKEVGLLGFTPNDARNEAYLNVPRLQTAAPGPAASFEPMDESPITSINRHSKTENRKSLAIPLLNWARAESARNPRLTEALLTEAAKYDPAAAAQTRADLGR